MNPYNFAALFFAFCSFLVGVLIWFRRQDNVGNIYLAFSFFVAAWGIGYSIMISRNVSYQDALFATRISQGLSLFIPVTWYHFILLFTGRINSKNKKLLFFLYSFSVFINFFSLSKFYIPSLKPAVGFDFFTRPGPLYHFYPLIYFLVVPLGFFELIKKIKQVSGKERTQYVGFFLATLFGFVGGSICFFPVYEIMIPQYGLFLMPIYPFMMAYFMMRRGLFDIEQVIQSFQREKLATIGLLAASVNHEIRNPLYVAKTTLESYIERQENSDQAKESLDISKKSLSAVNRALDVITKLNRFAKPSEETKDSRQKTQANIQEALKNVLDLVSYEFELDKIHIKNDIPSQIPLIQADQRQLEEILFNLIVNACHAMSVRKGDRQEVLPVPFSVVVNACQAVKQGGTLTISATRHCETAVQAKSKQSQRLRSLSRACQIASPQKAGLAMTVEGSRSPRNDDHIQITIQDTGSGIAPEQAKHLFEPFHTTKGENGTGLGLYITKQLVERNGGKIAVKSQEDKGTSFVLEFKIA